MDDSKAYFAEAEAREWKPTSNFMIELEKKFKEYGKVYEYLNDALKDIDRKSAELDSLKMRVVDLKASLETLRKDIGEKMGDTP